MPATTGSQTHPPRSLRLHSPSTLFVIVVQRAHVPLLHCHLPSDRPSPVMLRRSQRPRRLPNLMTRLNSLHTRSCSTRMEMQGTMILFPYHSTRPPWTRLQRRGMSTRMTTRFAKIDVSSRTLHPQIPIPLDLLPRSVVVISWSFASISLIPSQQRICSIPSHCIMVTSRSLLSLGHVTLSSGP
jgi:hypothetical protein